MKIRMWTDVPEDWDEAAFKATEWQFTAYSYVTSEKPSSGNKRVYFTVDIPVVEVQEADVSDIKEVAGKVLENE